MVGREGGDRERGGTDIGRDVGERRRWEERG